MVQFNNTKADTIASTVAEFHESKVFKKVLFEMFKKDSANSFNRQI